MYVDVPYLGALLNIDLTSTCFRQKESCFHLPMSVTTLWIFFPILCFFRRFAVVLINGENFAEVSEDREMCRLVI